MRLLALLVVPLTGCYLDAPTPVVVTQVRWHSAPVACLTLPPPVAPEREWCYSGDPVKDAECQADQNAKWADYGKTVEVWLRDYVLPTCYQAAGAAGGPK